MLVLNKMDLADLSEQQVKAVAQTPSGVAGSRRKLTQRTPSSARAGLLCTAPFGALLSDPGHQSVHLPGEVPRWWLLVPCGWEHSKQHCRIGFHILFHFNHLKF